MRADEGLFVRLNCLRLMWRGCHGYRGTEERAFEEPLWPPSVSSSSLSTRLPPLWRTAHSSDTLKSICPVKVFFKDICNICSATIKLKIKMHFPQLQVKDYILNLVETSNILLFCACYFCSILVIRITTLLWSELRTLARCLVQL